MREFMKSDGFQFQYERFIVPDAHTISFSKNTNKAMIGSINDLIYQAKFELSERGMSPHEASIGINDTPLSILNYSRPRKIFMAIKI